jgi:dethiobiotin synthetase
VKLLFVTATNTNIGKTFATLKLIEHISKHKLSVGVCKPIETGVKKNTPLDAKKLLDRCKIYNENYNIFSPKDITAYTFSLPASPFSADTKGVIEIDRIKSKIDELSKLCDILIIEGAGGLMVPIKSDYMMIDLIEDLRAKTLLITPSNLGCINDTLLSIEALKRRNIDFDWCINLYKDRDEFKKVTAPFYNSYFKNWWFLEDGLDSFIQNL